MVFQNFDADYIARLRDGDAATEEHFAAYFGELVYLKLRTRLRSQQTIEDIRQETLLRVLQTLRRKGGVDHPERFGAFVNAVCNNVLMEFFRSDRYHEPVEEQLDLSDQRVDLEGPLFAQDRRRQVEMVLRVLSEKDRELLRQVFLQEVDKDEICRRWNVDGDYLRVLLHRAKNRFRKVYLEQAAPAAAYSGGIQ